jgi:hypothetical protein
MTTTLNAPKSLAVTTLILPGPDRKRTQCLYTFRVTYRNPQASETGCVMTWEVGGGREAYQISLERTDDGEHAWHCSCADAVYRGEDNPEHVCKHVEGLLDTLPVVGRPVKRIPASAA